MFPAIEPQSNRNRTVIELQSLRDIKKGASPPVPDVDHPNTPLLHWLQSHKQNPDPRLSAQLIPKLIPVSMSVLSGGLWLEIFGAGTNRLSMAFDRNHGRCPVDDRDPTLLTAPSFIFASRYCIPANLLISSESHLLPAFPFLPNAPAKPSHGNGYASRFMI